MAAQRVVIVKDGDAMARAAAKRLVEACSRAIAARGVFSLALSGGSTPKKLYHLLAGEPYAGQIDWAKVEIFFGDERAVGPDHADSNFRMASEALLNQVPLNPERVHRLRGENALPAEAARYQKVMAKALTHAAGKPPELDMILLGLGTDAHTASLFPHTGALAETSAWVAANEVPQLKTSRLTLTYPVINAASEVVFLVSGADKVTALGHVMDGERNHAEYPAQGVRPQGDLIWMVDQAAAGGLPLALRGGNGNGA